MQAVDAVLDRAKVQAGAMPQHTPLVCCDPMTCMNTGNQAIMRASRPSGLSGTSPTWRAAVTVNSVQRLNNCPARPAFKATVTVAWSDT
jgi:hypothetical protein